MSVQIELWAAQRHEALTIIERCMHELAFLKRALGNGSDRFVPAENDAWRLVEELEKGLEQLQQCLGKSFPR